MRNVEFLTWRTGQPREVVEAWLSGPDVWFTAEQALAVLIGGKKHAQDGGEKKRPDFS